MFGGDTVEKRVTFIMVTKKLHLFVTAVNLLIEGMYKKSHIANLCLVQVHRKNVIIFILRDANVSPFKTLNTVSRWNGGKEQENDKRLHTIPEDLKCKSIKWMCGETFWGRHTAQPQELC